MFLNSKQEKAIQFCIIILESMSFKVQYPDIKTDVGKTSISEIRWKALNKSGDIAAHILLTKWDKKLKLIIWLPKNPDDGISAIDPYVVVASFKTHLILPNERGSICLHKISPDMFMTHQEMRDYLGY